MGGPPWGLAPRAPREGAGRPPCSWPGGGVLGGFPQQPADALSTAHEEGDHLAQVEATPSGPALRLRPALSVAGAPMQWDRPSCTLGSSRPEWI